MGESLFPRVSAIILTYNNVEDTIECVKSLLDNGYENLDIVIVDNCSEKEIREKLISHLQKMNLNLFIVKEDMIWNYKNVKEEIKRKKNIDIYLILNKRNYMYAGGNNRGIIFSLKYLDPDYILILNNDVILEKGLIGELIKKTYKAKADISAPIVYYYNDPTRIQTAGRNFNNLTLETSDCIVRGIPNRDYWDVDYLVGCCLLIKKEVFEKIGLFDEEYQLYYEEIDFEIKAKKEGFKILCIKTDRKIYHKASATLKASYLKTYFLVRNKFLFVRKHNRGYRFLLSFLYVFLVKIPKNFFYFTYLAVKQKNIDILKGFFKGLFDGLKYIILKEVGGRRK